MSRKQKEWNNGDKVIFNDLGNWGRGVVDSEGEESESSRWYWVTVEEMAIDSPEKDKRLVRADDLCRYNESKWKTISESVARLQIIRQETIELQQKIRETFESEFENEEAF